MSVLQRREMGKGEGQEGNIFIEPERITNDEKCCVLFHGAIQDLLCLFLDKLPISDRYLFAIELLLYHMLLFIW